MANKIMKRIIKSLLKRRNKVWATKASEVDGQWVNPNVKRDSSINREIDESRIYARKKGEK